MDQLNMPGIFPRFLVWYKNHFDLIWRRGWKRAYEYQGLIYRPYSDVEEAIIARCLALAEEHDASFVLEQAYSLREYLFRHPEDVPRFRALSDAGRFELRGCGEATIDINMCAGETMARNYASGIRYARKLLGVAPVIAHHGDGFGSSAQFPQVARLCGMHGISGLSYSKPDGPYWRGLDGSTVYVDFSHPATTFFYDHCYYEPCLTCHGAGVQDAAECPRCEGTGLRLSQGAYPPREWAEPIDGALGEYGFNSEEMLPDPNFPAQLAARNAEGREQYAWALPRDLLPLWEEALARVDDADVLLSSRVENNPTQSGTLVSRIRVKQAARRAEGTYYPAEALAALLTRGCDEQLRQQFDAAWLGFPLLFFHDAVTGTHNDPAQQELLDAAEAVVAESRRLLIEPAGKILPDASPVMSWSGEGYLTVFNAHPHAADIPVELPATGDGCRVADAGGQAMPVYREPGHRDLSARQFAPVGPDRWAMADAELPQALHFLAEDVPPMGMKTFHVQPRPAAAQEPIDARSVEWGHYRLGWGDTGVDALVDLASGQELLRAEAGPLAHLVLEEDTGDPWGTRSLQRARHSCVAQTRLLGAYRRGDAVEVAFAGLLDNGSFGREVDPGVFGLEWYQRVRLLRGAPWLEIDIEVFWQSVNRRLRVAFPSRSQTDRGLYHIPNGMLRRDRYEMTETNLWSPNGDWPALNFAATEPDGTTPGLAVINTGTPSARIEDGTLYYSILRSPGFGHCLLRYAQEYPMPLDGMHDGGWHRFRFAVLPFTGANLPQVLDIAQRLNTAAPIFRTGTLAPEWIGGLALDPPGAASVTVKFACDGGIAVRVVEQLGEAGTVRLRLPDWVEKAYKANLLEDPQQELAVRDGNIDLPLRAFEIATVLLG